MERDYFIQIPSVDLYAEWQLFVFRKCAFKILDEWK